MGSKVLDFFNMFDKIDDIIYEPVKVACEWLKQPLEQLKVSNDKKKAEHAQKLEMEMEEFKVKLEFERKRNDIEIDNIVKETTIQRQEKMVQLEMKYRTQLADLNSKMTKLMAEMQSEAIEALFTLIEEKKKSYLDVQCAYRKEIINTIKELQELGVGEETTAPILEEGFKKITEESATFQSMLVDSVERVSKIIAEDGQRASIRMDDYFRTRENEPSLLQKNIDIIE